MDTTPGGLDGKIPAFGRITIQGMVQDEGDVENETAANLDRWCRQLTIAACDKRVPSTEAKCTSKGASRTVKGNTMVCDMRLSNEGNQSITRIPQRHDHHEIRHSSPIGPVCTRHSATGLPPASSRVRKFPHALHTTPFTHGCLEFRPWETIPNDPVRVERLPSQC